jgi:citrate lyase subunit beta/citryl-CoA lyase
MVSDLTPPVSALFVPGSRPDRFAKAAESGAEAIIVDLEDAVAAPAKEVARQNAAAWTGVPTCRTFVRTNGRRTPWFADDLSALRSSSLDAIVLPKTESADDIAAVTETLRRAIPVVALIETARGLDRLPDILACLAVPFLAFGSIDFSLDLGCAHTRAALLNARTELVWRSRAAGKPGPIDGVTIKVDTPSHVLRDARHAASLGFSGKLAIHPNQVSWIRTAFLPDPVSIAWARRVITAGASDGVACVDGEMVDRPVVERARAILRRAGDQELVAST